MGDFFSECMHVRFQKCTTSILNHIKTCLSQNGRFASTESNKKERTPTHKADFINLWITLQSVGHLLSELPAPPGGQGWAVPCPSPANSPSRDYCQLWETHRALSRNVCVCQINLFTEQDSCTHRGTTNHPARNCFCPSTGN